jgi:AcrR family transcriptional regulator
MVSVVNDGVTRVVERTAKRRTALTRDRVVRAAVELADQSGIEALTMRRLGEAVGVEAMSLYNHVSGKDDLLDGMVDVIFSEFALSPAGDHDWKSQLRQRAVSARDVLARHRWAVGLLDSRSAPGPATLRHFDDVLGCLRRAGFSVETTVHAYGVIYCFVYGFVLSLNSDEQNAQVRQITDHAAPDQYPYACEVTEYVLRPGYDDMREFDRGLELILDGLERGLARDQTT